MKAVSTVPSFVEPSFKSELGELGLTATEIAASLGARKGDVVRSIKKFQEKGMITGRTQSCEGPDNSYEIFLTVPEAKFIVATYQNEVGWKYTRFLIAVEEAYKRDKAQSKVPTNFREALLLAAEQQLLLEQKDVVIEEQAVKLGESADWSHALRVKLENKLDIKDAALGKELSKLSRALGVEIKKANHAKYGSVNVYHRSVVEAFLRMIKED